MTNRRGSILMMVLIFGVILSVIGLATITFNSRNEIAALKEVNVARANFLADAGLEWGKVWVSSQCVVLNRLPEQAAGNAGFSEIGQINLGSNGLFTVGIQTVHSSTTTMSGSYILVSSGLVTGNGSGLTIRGRSFQFIINANKTLKPAAGGLTALSGHSATLLPNGKVLIAGGDYWLNMAAPYNKINNAFLYDPISNTFTPTDSMKSGRSGHEAVLLSDGDVFIAGGNNAAADKYEVFDTKNNKFHEFTPSSVGAQGQTSFYGFLKVVAGSNGTAFVFNGPKGNFVINTKNNSSALLQNTPPLLSQIWRFGAIGVPDRNEIHIFGGTFANGVPNTKLLTYNTDTKLWQTRDFELPYSREWPPSAVLTDNGKIVISDFGRAYIFRNSDWSDIIGGCVGTFGFSPVSTSSNMTAMKGGKVSIMKVKANDPTMGEREFCLLDIKTGNIELIKSLDYALRGYRLTALSDNKVLITGGGNLGAPCGFLYSSNPSLIFVENSYSEW